MKVPITSQQKTRGLCPSCQYSALTAHNWSKNRQHPNFWLQRITSLLPVSPLKAMPTCQSSTRRTSHPSVCFTAASMRCNIHFKGSKLLGGLSVQAAARTRVELGKSQNTWCPPTEDRLARERRHTLSSFSHKMKISSKSASWIKQSRWQIG